MPSTKFSRKSKLKSKSLFKRAKESKIARRVAKVKKKARKQESRSLQLKRINELTHKLIRIRTAKKNANNQRNEYKQLKATFNTLTHRYLNRDLSLKKGILLSTSFPNIYNSGIFKEVKILSKPSDSASGSLVILLKDIVNNYQYIIKYTMIEDVYEIEKNMAYVDIEMYKVMKSLLKRSVTPHIFQGVSQLHNIKKNKLPTEIINKMDIYAPTLDSGNYSKISTMLNETADGSVEMMTLNEFRSYLTKSKKEDNIKYNILVNILFQIIYTLEVFNLLDIKHNDLHFTNIFILIRKKNILKDNEDSVSRLYKFKTAKDKLIEVRLPNIGLDVRIYDFDRGYKPANNYKPYPNEIGSKYIDEYDFANQNYNKNHSFDTYKVVGSFISSHRRNPSEPDTFITHPDIGPIKFEELLKSFFYNEDLYKKGQINGELISFNPYFLLNRPLKNTEMKSTNEILLTLASEIPKTNLQIIETYSTEHIYNSPKEILLKTHKK